MKKYKQLTQVKRYQIFALIKQNLSITQIANNIGVHKSTISRELKRNSSDGYYSPEQASIKCFLRHRYKNKAVKLNKSIQKYIRVHLRLDYSPEQIAGRLKLDKDISISHETIYQYIYKNKKQGGKLYLLLAHKMKKYHKRDSIYKTRGMISNRVSIDKRPKIVDKKLRIGDIEVDIIIGKYHKQAIVSIVDRKSKFVLLKKTASKEAKEVAKAIKELLSPIKQISHTITSDNGKEFAYHEDIAKELGVRFYFCDPYSSWQRGLNENTNGLVRRYIPKGSDFSDISDEQIRFIQDRLNHRPRKSLGYKTPYEVFMKEFIRKMVA